MAKTLFQDHDFDVEVVGSGMVGPAYEKLYGALLEEHAELRQQLAQVQEQLAASLAGNAELLAQLKTLQEKLDRLLSQKKNRDRKEFDTKNEGHNPSPAPAGTKAAKQKKVVTTADTESPPKPSFVDCPDIPPEIIPHPVAEADRICPHCNVETSFVGYQITHQLEKLATTL